MLYIAYAFKGEVHVFAGRVKTVLQDKCSIKIVVVVNGSKMWPYSFLITPFKGWTLCSSCLYL